MIDADIRQCFDSLLHIAIERNLVRCGLPPDVARLVLQLCCGPAWGGQHGEVRNTGIPLGSPLSPLLSNVALNELDQTLDTAEHPLVRYADDFLVFGHTACECEEVRKVLDRVLAGLGLVLNLEKTRMVSFDEGYCFLGTRFLADRIEVSPARARPSAGLVASRHTPRVSARLNNQFCAQYTTSPAEREKLDHCDPNAIPSVQDVVRTLYLAGHGWHLSTRHGRLVVRQKDGGEKAIPAPLLGQVVVLGNGTLTTPAIGLCLRHGIPLVLGTGATAAHGNVDAYPVREIALLRRQLQGLDDPNLRLRFSRSLVAGKLRAMAVVLRRYARHRVAPALEQAQLDILRVRQRLETAGSLAELRGHEGFAARRYFGAWKEVLPGDLGFFRRERRPPPDPVNVMLSYGYSLLFASVRFAVCRAGLDERIGLMHDLRRGHPALVSDLMEEFRPLVVDSLCLNLLLNRRITATDFETPQGEKGICLMTPDARKRFIQHFEAKLGAADESAEPDRPSLRRAIGEQVAAFRRMLLGESDVYIAVAPR